MSTAKYRYLTSTYSLLILLVSSVPGRVLVTFKFVGWDKFFHLLEYAVLGWLLVHSLGEKRLASVWAILLGGILFGAFNEVWQLLISARSASIYDWLADVLGVVLGGMVGFLVITKRRISLPGNSG